MAMAPPYSSLEVARNQSAHSTLEAIPNPPPPPPPPPQPQQKCLEGAELENTAKPRLRLWKRPWSWALGLLLICVVGAVVGGVVGGTRRKHGSAPVGNPPGASNSTNSTVSPSGPVTFSAVYSQGDPGEGIGGYDLLSSADRSFAFDYDHSGKLDYIVLYRPGAGAIFILKNENGTSYPVYDQGAPGSGIGGYDLKSPADRAFAFDYEHSGKLDYLVLYRPGGGSVWILKNDNGNFSAVYAQSGIAGYDFASPDDHAFAFDLDHSGKLEYIATYRPGTGTFWIIKNVNGTFEAVYQQGDPGFGIGGYDLQSPADSVIAFDYEHTGKMDHLVLYRPGNGTIWILKHDGSDFIPVYHQGEPGNGVGIGGFDLSSPSDSAFAFDYGSTGRQDYLVLYRPGAGLFEIMKNTNGTFTPVYGQDPPGEGIGGYDLRSSADLGYAFDYRQTGKLDHIVLYRPGTGAIFIVEESTVPG